LTIITSSKRCLWATSSLLEENYHDHEWGVPVHDDRLLFELLSLEGAQAGLSWSTILKKRAAYQVEFDHFEANIIVNYDAHKMNQLLSNPDLVRNPLKLKSVVTNARAFLEIQKSFGGFDHYLWQFVGGDPVQNSWKNHADIPTFTDLSKLMSKDLKARGFKFVGPIICYAYMQAIGMINDHTVDCFRYEQLKKTVSFKINPLN
jgi:DNA-3-methyladenine glycosylase I